MRSCFSSRTIKYPLPVAEHTLRALCDELAPSSAASTERRLWIITNLKRDFIFSSELMKNTGAAKALKLQRDSCSPQEGELREAAQQLFAEWKKAYALLEGKGDDQNSESRAQDRIVTWRQLYDFCEEQEEIKMALFRTTSRRLVDEESASRHCSIAAPFGLRGSAPMGSRKTATQSAPSAAIIAPVGVKMFQEKRKSDAASLSFSRTTGKAVGGNGVLAMSTKRVKVSHTASGAVLVEPRSGLRNDFR